MPGVGGAVMVGCAELNVTAFCDGKEVVVVVTAIGVVPPGVAPVSSGGP